MGTWDQVHARLLADADSVGKIIIAATASALVTDRRTLPPTSGATLPAGCHCRTRCIGKRRAHDVVTSAGPTGHRG